MRPQAFGRPGESIAYRNRRSASGNEKKSFLDDFRHRTWSCLQLARVTVVYLGSADSIPYQRLLLHNHQTAIESLLPATNMITVPQAVFSGPGVAIVHHQGRSAVFGDSPRQVPSNGAALRTDLDRIRICDGESLARIKWRCFVN